MGLVAICVDHGAIAILLAIAPLAPVFASIWPSQGSLTLPEVLVVPASIDGAIGPLHGSLSMHVTPLPLAHIGAAICEVVGALTIHLVVIELASEDNIPSTGLVGSTAMLAPVQELPFIAGTISPALDTFSALLILRPLALVSRTILVDVLTVAMSAILVPLPLVDVSVRSDEFALTMSSASNEGALVPRTIWPAQDAVAVTLCSTPLALVLGASLHLSLRPLFEFIASALGLASQGSLIYHGVGSDPIQEPIVAIAVLRAARTATEYH
mmetsp:Transcript_75954/g.158411  ORF Transcript_75954/g.158411 Transcript_75954/m.158411 type:complete len:269 (+) Transcript_75954:575-1381(+)|eukprot:CAMPEP_0206453280 /NCGR_PEP_ID=MMETSP0324_2-20121206/20455_1 /ASSEMBLY_ACC=CAM_ASM_000836 /TAXON_ID=2866 /ORGANISM="Crypthecodinium cohnii, Strain Seligo" /LENGTH=268 /DNA_ID=CAMNT_0053923547 /DNA_START=790 /DNA_END=1596 /DNA_ORIENTATION=+